MNKLTQKFVEDYYAKYGYILKSIYKGMHYKDTVICPANHEIEMTYKNFKSHGNRCAVCSGVAKLTHEHVDNYYKANGYTLQNIYKNNTFKNKLVCPEGHIVYINFRDFKHDNTRCRTCYLNSNWGENHHSFNPNREEITLNLRLRTTRKKKWIIKHMKSDPNYNEFIKDPDSYVIDHIIPVKLFCQLHTKYNLDETEVRKIINQRENLQLLTYDQNRDKGTNGSSLFEATNFLINNGMSIMKFLEENKKESPSG